MFFTALGITTSLITFVLLTAVGCDLTVDDFRAVKRRPVLVAAGLVVPPLVLPLVALGLIAWMAPPPAIASGLLLIAICPVGGISNTWAYLAGGAPALSVTLTTLSCLLAGVTVPALGAMVAFATKAAAPVQFSPLGLSLQVLAMVVLPVAIGMRVRRRWPRFAVDRRPAMQRGASILLAGLIAMIIGSDAAGFVATLGAAVPLAAAFIVASMAVGGIVGHALGGTTADRITLAIEFATRNVAVAAALAVSVGRIESATFATTYFLTEVPMMLVLAAGLRALPAARRVRVQSGG